MQRPHRRGRQSPVQRQPALHQLNLRRYAIPQQRHIAHLVGIGAQVLRPEEGVNVLGDAAVDGRLEDALEGRK